MAQLSKIRIGYPPRRLVRRGLGALDDQQVRVYGGIAVFVGFAALAVAIITIGRL